MAGLQVSPLLRLTSSMEKRKREGEEEGRNVLVPAREPDLHYVGKTGICYDVRFRYHSKLAYVESYLDPHPEDPRRTFRIYKTLAESGLLIDEYLSGTSDLGPLMQKVDAVEATEDQLLQVHTRDHLRYIASVETMDQTTLREESENGDSIYLNTDSYLSAKLSCGGAIESCRAVVEGKVRNSIAVIRPPGHHAEPDAPGGFCLFSNVAVAAKIMLREYEHINRIVILDWDIHHGNGTQKAFYDDPRVLYISIHRYNNGSFYPGKNKGGAANKVGEGEGLGYNVNIPWNGVGMTDGDYLTAMYRVVLPICGEYNPDLVIISSGFDAADGDPIGQCHVSPMGYAQMTHLMKTFCDGKLVVCLEGGYNLDSISVSALAVTKVLLGEPPGRPKTICASPTAMKTIEEVTHVQSHYWKSLGPQFPLAEPDTELETLQEVVRSHEVSRLANKYSFTGLPAIGPLAQLGPNQVVCSPNIYNADKLLVIVHDSPLIWAHTDLVNGAVSPNDSTVLCPNTKFIEWAMANQYGVVDIYIPSEEVAASQNLLDAHDLIASIWDHSLRNFAATNIAFVGIGQAYGALVYLVGHRDLRDRCEAIIAFLCDDHLKSLVPAGDEGVVDWFYRTGLLFTNHSHKCWDNPNHQNGPKRPRKRMGRVIRTNSNSIYEMIEEKFKDSTDYILNADA